MSSINWKLLKPSYLIAKLKVVYSSLKITFDFKSLGILRDHFSKLDFRSLFKSLDLKLLKYEFSRVKFKSIFNGLFDYFRGEKIMMGGEGYKNPKVLSPKKGYISMMNVGGQNVTGNGHPVGQGTGQGGHGTHTGQKVPRGYFKYPCAFWLPAFGDNWLWVANSTCAECSGKGRVSDLELRAMEERERKQGIEKILRERQKEEPTKYLKEQGEINRKKWIKASVAGQIDRGFEVFEDRPYPNYIKNKYGEWRPPKYTHSINVGTDIPEEHVYKAHYNNAHGYNIITAIWRDKNGIIILEDKKYLEKVDVNNGIRPEIPVTTEEMVKEAFNGKDIPTMPSNIKGQIIKSPVCENFTCFASAG